MNILNRFFLIGSVVITATAQAQSDSEPITIPGGFDTVRVHPMYSKRISYSTDNIGQNVQIISREDIEKLPVQTTAELLAYTLGIDLRQRGVMGTQSDLQMQGSTFDQVLVLIDGVKMSDPQTGHHQMNISISPEAIERIEVIKGASARRYGLNALAGVVNIITRMPQKPQLSAQVHSGTGFGRDSKSNALYANQGFRLFNTLGNKNFSVWYDIAADMGSGYRHNTDFQGIRSNFRIQQRIQHKNRFLKQEGVHLNYSGSIFRNSFGANGFYAAPADSNAYEYVNTQWGSISADIETIKHGTFNFRLSGRGNNDQYVFIKENPSYYRNFHQTTVLTPEMSYKYMRKFYELGFGAEYRKEQINSTNLGVHLREFEGMYVDVLIMPIKGVRLSGGVYGLHNNILGYKLYPGADINVQVSKQIFAFASTGTGQRLPTYTDLYYSGPSNLSNPLLMAEKANYSDVGLRSNGKKLVFHISAFRRNNQALIDRTKDSLNAPWRPVNLQSFDIKGIEANVKYQIKLKQIFKSQGGLRIEISTGISRLFTGALNTQSISQYTLNYLPVQWMSQLNLHTQSLHLSINGRYLERYGLQTNQINKYTLVDARFDYLPKMKDKRPMKLFLILQNIGNTAYREFTTVPLMGRWLSAGISLLID
ncbi:MAG: TonB-dependent receptor plug domain-containing protein [bacterium]|nr:TonB-dependent receptor plug domain-containing protein [bacterium]